MTLQEFLRTLWFGRWLMAAAMVAALVGTSYFVERQVPVYATSASVTLTDPATLQSAGVRLSVRPGSVASVAVAERAAAALGDPSLAPSIAASVTPTLSGETGELIVTAVRSDAGEAVATANAMADAYVVELQADFDSQVAALVTRRDALAETITQIQPVINAARAENAPDGLLEAQYSSAMEQYQSLSGQIVQAELVGSPASVRAGATVATRENIPPRLLYLIGALGGLLLGVGVAMVRRGIDTKVRSPGSARRAADAPVLAQLRGTGGSLRAFVASDDLPVAVREATPFTESVRELRTALQAALPGRAGVVIVVTSADLDAPRSFVAANLAASWALSGRSVIAMSGDLRQPRLHRMLHSGEDDAASAQGKRHDRGDGGPVPTRIPHLRTQPPLRTELDPADYLASDHVRSLVDDLRKQADVVVIDAPPLLVAADAAILGTLSDGVLLIATTGRSETGALSAAADRLRLSGARLLGIALDVRRRAGSSYRLRYAFHDQDASSPSAGQTPHQQSRENVLAEVP